MNNLRKWVVPLGASLVLLGCTPNEATERTLWEQTVDGERLALVESGEASELVIGDVTVPIDGTASDVDSFPPLVFETEQTTLLALRGTEHVDVYDVGAPHAPLVATLPTTAGQVKRLPDDVLQTATWEETPFVNFTIESPVLHLYDVVAGETTDVPFHHQSKASFNRWVTEDDVTFPHPTERWSDDWMHALQVDRTWWRAPDDVSIGDPVAPLFDTYTDRIATSDAHYGYETVHIPSGMNVVAKDERVVGLHTSSSVFLTSYDELLETIERQTERTFHDGDEDGFRLPRQTLVDGPWTFDVYTHDDSGRNWSLYVTYDVDSEN